MSRYQAQSLGFRRTLAESTAFYLLCGLQECGIQNQLGMRSSHANKMDRAPIPGWSLKVQGPMPFLEQQLVAMHCQSSRTVPAGPPKGLSAVAEEC